MSDTMIRALYDAPRIAAVLCGVGLTSWLLVQLRERALPIYRACRGNAKHRSLVDRLATIWLALNCAWQQARASTQTVSSLWHHIKWALLALLGPVAFAYPILIGSQLIAPRNAVGLLLGVTSAHLILWAQMIVVAQVARKPGKALLIVCFIYWFAMAASLLDRII